MTDLDQNFAWRKWCLKIKNFWNTIPKSLKLTSKIRCSWFRYPSLRHTRNYNTSLLHKGHLNANPGRVEVTHWSDRIVLKWRGEVTDFSWKIEPVVWKWLFWVLRKRDENFSANQIATVRIFEFGEKGAQMKAHDTPILKMILDLKSVKKFSRY